jgi:DNA-binding MarR family transcriptional regulator
MLGCPAGIGERQFRVLIALAFDARPPGRRSAPGMELLAAYADCSPQAARASLRRLQARGLVEQVSRPARGHRVTYEIVKLDLTEHAQAYPVTEHAQAYPVEPTEHAQAYPVNAARPDDPRSAQQGTDWPSTGAAQAYPSTKAKDQNPVPAPADRARDDDQPDWLRGPRQAARALTGRIIAPGQRPVSDRPTPTPPHWHSPRTNPPPEISHDGATIARKLIADRPRPAGAEPDRIAIKDLDEDARRAVALRQANAARRERERADPPKPAEPPPPEPPAEEPPDEMPF